jgi:hypothetical protein
MDTLEILLSRYNGHIFVPFARVGEAIGMSTQTARNRLSNGTFPIKTFLQGSRRFVHISDLASYIDSVRTPVQGEAK